MNDIRINRFFPDLPVSDLTVLDIGAGDYTSSVAHQVTQFPFKKLISYDAWLPDLAKQPAVQAKIHERILGDVTTKELPKADMVFMFDVMEHLKNPWPVLEKVEALSPKLILIFSPIEEIFRIHPSKGRLDENPYQEHRILLKAEDFISRGYQVEILPKFHNADNRQFDAFWAWKP